MAGVLCRVVIKWPLLQWDTRSNNKNNVSVWNINWHNFQIGFPSSRNKILQKKTLVIIYIWCLFETVLAAATFTRFNLIKLVSVKNLWLYLSGFSRVELVSVWSCRDQPRGEMHQKNVPLFKSSLLQQTYAELWTVQIETQYKHVSQQSFSYFECWNDRKFNCNYKFKDELLERHIWPPNMQTLILVLSLLHIW